MSTTAAAVRAAIECVEDPELSGVSIGDLGMVHDVVVDEAGRAHIELVPTHPGCPALEIIAADVRVAAERIAVVGPADVVWRRDLAWSPAAVSPAARATLATELTVTLRTADGSLRCPACGSRDVEDRATVGPTRCRSVAWCHTCRNVVEVLR